MQNSSWDIWLYVAGVYIWNPMKQIPRPAYIIGKFGGVLHGGPYIVNQCWREGKKEVMLRVFWGKVKYIEGILGIEILFRRMEGKNEKKKKKRA
jgi:hypothetical protein